jgi:hypothetical protein
MTNWISYKNASGMSPWQVDRGGHGLLPLLWAAKIINKPSSDAKVIRHATRGQL